MNQLRIVVFSALFIQGSLGAQPKTFFVSPGGSDGNNGQSTAAPFATISHGVTLMSPGDTLYLLPGTYREYVRVIQRQGSPEKPLHIVGYYHSSPQRPVIDGGAQVPSNDNTVNYWMDLEQSQWLEVGNIEFRNGWTNPIKVVNSSYVTFSDCYFYGGKRIVNVSGANSHHILIQRCFWDQGGDSLWTRATDATGVDAWTSMHEGLLQYYNGSLVNLAGSGGSVVIRDNTIVNAFNALRWTAVKNYDTNIEIYNNTISKIRDNDIEPEYYTYNLHIFHNRSHNIHKTLSIDHVEGGNIYYYGNELSSDADTWSNTICTGFWKVYGEGTTNLSYPMYAFNNSFCGVGKAFSMDAGTLAVNVKHFNNAYYFTGSRGWELTAVDSTDAFDYDISNRPWPPNITGPNQEIHGKQGIAGFKNTATFDLRLNSGSAALDGGTSLSLPEFNWTQSYRGAAPDMGAYEGDTLVEGPPFRFRAAPGAVIQYAEKPRIVRSRTSGSALTLYFSAPLDSNTISVSGITLSASGSNLNVVNAGLSEEGYRLDINVSSGAALHDSTLTIEFTPLPKGLNGETATLWASPLMARASSLPLGMAELDKEKAKEGAGSLVIYPNPFNNSAHVSLHLSGAVNSRATFAIYDILGRKITETEFVVSGDGREFAIDDDGLATGEYIAVVRAGKQFFAQKFMVLK